MDWKRSREDEESPVGGAGMVRLRAWRMAWIRGIWRLREKQGLVSACTPGQRVELFSKAESTGENPDWMGEQP